MFTQPHNKRMRAGSNNELWLKMLSSGWFNFVLCYLNTIEQVVKLDSMILNHTDRKHWLQHLKTLKVSLDLDTDKYYNLENQINWVVLKELKIEILSIFFGLNKAMNNISRSSIIRLTKSNPNLKKLKLTGDFTSTTLFKYVAKYCHKIEELDIQGSLPIGALSLLGSSCHELKIIVLDYFGDEKSHNEMESLLKNNQNLKSFSLIDVILIEEEALISTLGKYCPLLETIYLERIESSVELTQTHIETFTRGCRYLQSVKIEYIGYLQGKCNKLFQCLGTYNPNLLELELCLDIDTIEMQIMLITQWQGSEHSLFVVENITTHSLQCLTQGCRQLKRFFFPFLNIPQNSFTDLDIYCHEIDTIEFFHCELSVDCLSHMGKLPKLKVARFIDIKTITDENITQLVKNKNNMIEEININYCDHLTNASLLSIATHCPHLKTLAVDNNTHFKTEFYYLLYARCEQLVNMYGAIPKKLLRALKTRKDRLQTNTE